MSTFGTVLGQFSELYAAGNYSDALVLVNHSLADLPDYESILLCFSAAMSARLGDTAGALSTFRTALDKGYWYHEGALRGDPDFASLQSDAEFQSIIEQNAQRRQAALAEVKPLVRVLEPAGALPSAPLLIALHGNLSNIDSFASYLQPLVEQGWRVALAQSSRPTWVSGFYDWQDIEVGLTELDGHYQALTANGTPSQVIITGFSMGALVAERAAITKRIPASGLFWVEGAPDDQIDELLSAHQPHHFRAYFAAGQSQDFQATAETLSKSLSAAGVPCEIEAMPNAYHDFPATFPQTLERALAFLGT